MSSKQGDATPHRHSRSRSLAARLTVWYALSSFTLILLATGYLYWALARNLDREDDHFLADQALPLINLLMLLGLPVSKAVLVRRGIFRSTLMRATGALALDDDDQHELDAILDDLRPLFRI